MKILAVSPHPDDIEYSISGILLKVRNKIKDANITIAYNTKYDLTDLNVSTSHDIRKNEAQMACRILGANYLEYSLNDSLNRIAMMILEEKPDIVFLPYINDTNGIHKKITENFICAIEIARKETATQQNIVGQLFYYEAYSSVDFDADYIIDVSEVFTEAKRILMCHKIGISTLKVLPYKFTLVHQLNGLRCAMPYGEGLIRDKSDQYNWSSNIKLLSKFLYELTN